MRHVRLICEPTNRMFIRHLFLLEPHQRTPTMNRMFIRHLLLLEPRDQINRWPSPMNRKLVIPLSFDSNSNSWSRQNRMFIRHLPLLETRDQPTLIADDGKFIRHLPLLKTRDQASWRTEARETRSYQSASLKATPTAGANERKLVRHILLESRDQPISRCRR